MAAHVVQVANEQKKLVGARLIYNPGAGNSPDARARLKQVVECLRDHGFAPEVNQAGPSAEATALAHAAAQAGYRLVIAMGGDGTIEAVARGLIHTRSCLGIIPNGTYNNLAKSLGIPEDVDRVCRLFEHGYERRIDVGQIEFSGERHPFFEVASLGLSATLFPSCEAVKEGQWQQIVDVVTRFFAYTTHKAHMILDENRQVDVETMLITVANTPAFGANFLVAPKASLEDGVLEICTYPNFSKPELVAYFVSIANGGHADDPRIRRYQARTIQVIAEPPMAANADGEMIGTGNYIIRILPASLRVITGAETGLARDPVIVAEGEIAVNPARA